MFSDTNVGINLIHTTIFIVILKTFCNQLVFNIKNFALKIKIKKNLPGKVQVQ